MYPHHLHQHRYESSGSHISPSQNGAFLGTAREKRDKLIRKANLSQSRNGTTRSLMMSSPPPMSDLNESFFGSSRLNRSYHQQNSRAPSVDGTFSSPHHFRPASSSIEANMTRTASQSSLNHLRASPCPSDISFSYSNPKYFVRTAVLRPAMNPTNQAEMHYESAIVSFRIRKESSTFVNLICIFVKSHRPFSLIDIEMEIILTNLIFGRQRRDPTSRVRTVIQSV